MALQHKGTPVNPYSFIIVMNLFPLVGVIMGELDYLSLILLYIIDTFMVVFFNMFRMIGTTPNYGYDHTLYNKETVSGKEKLKYRFEVYLDYYLGHFFILIILSLFMMLPAAVANPKGEDFAISSMIELLYQKWFQWVMALNFIFHLSALFYYYKSRDSEKYTVEYLARVDTKKYMLLFIIMFAGTLFAGFFIQIFSVWAGIIIYSTLLAFAKIYLDIRDYREDLKFELSD